MLGSFFHCISIFAFIFLSYYAYILATRENKSTKESTFNFVDTGKLARFGLGLILHLAGIRKDTTSAGPYQLEMAGVSFYVAAHVLHVIPFLEA